jgi:hypothetical protein
MLAGNVVLASDKFYSVYSVATGEPDISVGSSYANVFNLINSNFVYPTEIISDQISSLVIQSSNIAFENFDYLSSDNLSATTISSMEDVVVSSDMLSQKLSAAVSYVSDKIYRSTNTSNEIVLSFIDKTDRDIASRGTSPPRYALDFPSYLAANVVEHYADKAYVSYYRLTPEPKHKMQATLLSVFSNHSDGRCVVSCLPDLEE